MTFGLKSDTLTAEKNDQGKFFFFLNRGQNHNEIPLHTNYEGYTQEDQQVLARM